MRYLEGYTPYIYLDISTALLSCYAGVPTHSNRNESVLTATGVLRCIEGRLQVSLLDSYSFLLLLTYLAVVDCLDIVARVA